MRERDINAKKFHKGHYEIIAARFREALEPYMGQESNATLLSPDFVDTKTEMLAVRSAIVNLAIDFARRLQADNDLFEPVIFLDRCSPNVVLYPLGELWEVAQGDDTHSVRV